MSVYIQNYKAAHCLQHVAETIHCLRRCRCPVAVASNAAVVMSSVRYQSGSLFVRFF